MIGEDMNINRVACVVLAGLMISAGFTSYEAQTRQNGYRFTDMIGHWAENTVSRLAGLGIVSGRDDLTFDPEGTVTRAEFVALLVRSLGVSLPKGAKDPGFEDVKKQDWYYDYVMRAYANGIATGVDKDTFDPNGIITRELMVKMMVDALKLDDMNVDWYHPADTTMRYKDWGAVSQWAKDEVEKAVMIGLIKGKLTDILAPADTATRAEAATLIERMLEVDEYLSSFEHDQENHAGNLKPEIIEKRVRLFSDSSEFNQKISSTAKVDEKSGVMVKSLIAAYNSRGIIVTRNSYSVSVFYADRSTPRYNVRRAASWAGGTVLYDVPVPDFAVPDSGEGHMAIIDLSSGYEYDFWLAKKSGAAWTAGWANKISYRGDGVYPDGLAARGSGMALTAGMIWPEELRNGHIDHALVFSYPYTKARQYVYPASKTDGTSTRADAIPMGARIQLDPTLNLDSIGLTSYEKTIARAMQEYGMILCDTSGGPIELEAVNPVSAKNDSYEGLLPKDTFVFLKKIPVERLRVLEID